MIMPHRPPLSCFSLFLVSFITTMAVAAKFFTIALALGLVHSSLQSHFIQDDILAFPRYKVVVTREKVSNTDVSLKHAEVRCDISRIAHALFVTDSMSI